MVLKDTDTQGQARYTHTQSGYTAVQNQQDTTNRTYRDKGNYRTARQKIGLL